MPGSAACGAYLRPDESDMRGLVSIRPPCAASSSVAPGSHSQQRGLVQLSILIPSHRHDLLTCGRIAQACSWASPQIEVIVRDNSGDAQKHELIAQFHNDYCRIISVEPCDAITNVTELLRVAQGDFVYIMADDDFCFQHTIAALPGIIDQSGKDSSVVGVTGAYVIETTNGTKIDSYESIDDDDARARVIGYLKYGGPNVLFYSPVRRQVVQRVFALMTAAPLQFPFHDQVLCLLYLLSGKFVRLPRLIYGYDMGVWENSETAQRQDLNFYSAMQLDPAINKLHWFLCAFEGAVLIANPALVPDYSMAQRQPIADLWFSLMFARFKQDTRNAYGSRFTGDAEKLVAKWQASNGPLSFDSMLSDIRDFIALFSESKARHYFEFWNAVLNKRDPLAQEAVAASA